MARKPAVLILCTGNSCRSQMAEGLLRHLAGDRFEVLSAGTDPKDQVHPLAVRAMAEMGIDISDQRPKHLDEATAGRAVGHLIVVCDGANESCPAHSPGIGERLFWPFDDPAGYVGSNEEVLPEFRRVRDEIKAKFLEWLPTV